MKVDDFMNKKIIKFILIIILCPVIFFGQYYLFKNGIINPMIKGINVELIGGNYIKNINKYVIKLNDTVTISPGKYIILPRYSKEPNIWFNILDDKKVIKIKGDKITALKEGYTSIGIMSKNRVIKKAVIMVVNPKIDNVYVELSKKLKYVGDYAYMKSEIEINEYSKLKKSYKAIYKTDNEAVLKIEGNKVIAISPGNAKIITTYENKKIETSVKIEPKVKKLDADDFFYVEVDEKKKINPYIEIDPKQGNTPEIKYSIVKDDVEMKDYNLEYDDLEQKGLNQIVQKKQVFKLNTTNGEITGLSVGRRKVKISCGDIEKIITVVVNKKSIENMKPQNIQYSTKLKNEKIEVTLYWDYLDDVDKYYIYLKNKYSQDYMVSTVIVDKDYLGDLKTVFETISLPTDIEGISNYEFYIQGYSNSDLTKKSNPIYVELNKEKSDKKINSLKFSIDEENKIINFNWKPIEDKDKDKYKYNICLKKSSDEDFKIIAKNLTESNFKFYTIKNNINYEFCIQVVEDAKRLDLGKSVVVKKQFAE